MRPKAKYAVIYRHRDEYPVSVMCKFFEVSRSGYYDFVKRTGQPERDAELAEKIKEYVKGWTSTNTVATAKDIYGNIIATVEENVYHTGNTRTKTEHFNTYQCFVCGQKTRD